MLPDLIPGNRTHELAAIVALIRSRAIPANRIAGIIDHNGSAVRVVQLSEEDRLFVPPDATHDIIGAVTPEGRQAAIRDVEAWERRKLDVRSVLDPNYPANLHEIFNRPPLLFFVGSWREETDSRAVAVVGTRSASPAGIARARRLSRELVRAGFTVISGLATGIDAAAHAAALDAGGRTVAVMGTGIDFIYPPQNEELAKRIVESGGALISQFFPHQMPTSWTFPMRNVTMSGLALATVVVEASSTSGARMQARVALQHGRTVFLLESLVEAHEWARRYVEEGVYGTRAVKISSTEEIVERLNGAVPEDVLVSS